jgi:hypothetical protein
MRRLLSQLDTPVNRIVDVGEDTTRERIWRSGFADRQSALPERRDRGARSACAS